MNFHDYFTIGYAMFWLAIFFLPTIVAIGTQNQRYLIVGVLNVTIGWTGLGWAYLLWKVWPRHSKQ